MCGFIDFLVAISCDVDPHAAGHQCFEASRFSASVRMAGLGGDSVPVGLKGVCLLDLFSLFSVVLNNSFHRRGPWITDPALE